MGNQLSLGDLEFKKEDFDKTRCLFTRMSDFAWFGVTAVLRDEANRILREKLETVPEVGTRNSFTNANPWGADWSEALQVTYHTHKARLVCIEKIK